jgi:hypothetical protein
VLAGHPIHNQPEDDVIFAIIILTALEMGCGSALIYYAVTNEIPLPYAVILPLSGGFLIGSGVDTIRGVY